MERIKQLAPDDAERSRALAEGYRILGDSASANALTTQRARGTFVSERAQWISQHGGEVAVRGTLAYLAITAEWVERYPDTAAAWLERLTALASAEKPSPEALAKAGEAAIAAPTQTPRPSRPYALQVAEIWLEHGVRLVDVARFAAQARAGIDQTPVARRDDRLLPSGPAGPDPTFAQTQAWRIEIDADRKRRDFAAARAALAEMKSWTDAHPTWTGPANVYHLEHARVAEDAGEQQEALDAYRQAWPDEESAGHARALWKSLGKPPESFDVWWHRE
jgi:hypothetical protein